MNSYSSLRIPFLNIAFTWAGLKVIELSNLLCGQAFDVHSLWYYRVCSVLVSVALLFGTDNYQGSQMSKDAAIYLLR